MNPTIPLFVNISLLEHNFCLSYIYFRNFAEMNWFNYKIIGILHYSVPRELVNTIYFLHTNTHAVGNKQIQQEKKIAPHIFIWKNS